VRYEFGTKVSVAATTREGFIVGMRALPGNPYDGHTLAEALEQVEVLTDCRPSLAVVDRGYRGHGVETTRVLISGTRRARRHWQAPAPSQRHRTRDRPHEDRRQADALSAQGHDRRRHLRRPLLLRPQHPQNPAHLRALLALLIAAILGALRSDCAPEDSAAAA
jgi:IS5 family transposase